MIIIYFVNLTKINVAYAYRDRKERYLQFLETKTCECIQVQIQKDSVFPSIKQITIHGSTKSLHYQVLLNVYPENILVYLY